MQIFPMNHKMWREEQIKKKKSQARLCVFFIKLVFLFPCFLAELFW